MALIPHLESRKLTATEWITHTPNENKLELLEGIAIDEGEERDRLILALVYNTGLKHFFNKILPAESQELLRELVNTERRKG